MVCSGHAKKSGTTYLVWSHAMVSLADLHALILCEGLLQLIGVLEHCEGELSKSHALKSDSHPLFIYAFWGEKVAN